MIGEYMSQTIEGSKKAKAKLLAKYGENYFKSIGSTGGKVKNPLKGFGTNRELAVTAGYKGGKISKRK